jgi:DNA-binding PadR family transcriptional regulator
MLALLTAEPMTGYDIAQHFDEAVAQLWAAPHSQIYPELRKMEDDGLVRGEEVPRGEKATKRVYTLTAEGREEFARWLMELEPYPAERNVHRLKSAYFEMTSFDAARHQLLAHLNYYSRRLDQWRELRNMISARTHPLLRLRLSTRPETEHEAIVAFKGLAFEGMIARAEAEISWAERGLQVIDELEASQARMVAARKH